MKNCAEMWTPIDKEDHRGWMRSACSCSFVSSRAVIASLESAPFLSSSLRVGSPRSLYFLRVPQEGFPATELASRRPGHCISTRTCIRGSASSSTGLSPHCIFLATVDYSFCSWVWNVRLRHVSSVTQYVQRGSVSFMQWHVSSSTVINVINIAISSFSITTPISERARMNSQS
jgi:hypothetical protein